MSGYVPAWIEENLWASSTAHLPPPVHKRHRSTRHILAPRRGHLLPVQRHEGHVRQVKRQPAVWSRRSAGSRVLFLHIGAQLWSLIFPLQVRMPTLTFQWISMWTCKDTRRESGNKSFIYLFIKQTFIHNWGHWECWSLSQHHWVRDRNASPGPLRLKDTTIRFADGNIMWKVGRISSINISQSALKRYIHLICWNASSLHLQLICG